MAGRLGELLDVAIEGGASLGAFVTEAGVERGALDADTLYPLASVRKVVTLGAYAVAVAGGVLDSGEVIPVGDVGRWHWPDTDGGAHRRAREWWRSDHVPLDALAEAMIRFSDNASADYLLDRLGIDAVDSFVRQTGMVAQEPILPVLGEFRAWHRSSECWITLGAGGRVAEAWGYARSAPTAAEDSEIDEATRRRCAAVGCRGTPREWGNLMSRIARGAGLPAAAVEVMRCMLEVGGVSEDPAEGRFGRKGGDLPGVLTFAGYVRDRAGDRPDVTVALFLRDLAADWQVRLAEALPQNSSELLALAGAVSARGS